MNKDQRYKRYENDPKFHRLVRVMEQAINEFNFTHQDLQDACFVAYMKFLERNPIPLCIYPDISDRIKK